MYRVSRKTKGFKHQLNQATNASSLLFKITVLYPKRMDPCVHVYDATERARRGQEKGGRPSEAADQAPCSLGGLALSPLYLFRPFRGQQGYLETASGRCKNMNEEIGLSVK